MSRHVRVNPIACEAHGMCAELLPERIALDEWGYPMVDDEPLPDELLAHAERAAQACPTFALLLQRDRSDAHGLSDAAAAARTRGVNANVRVSRRTPRQPGS